MLATMTVAVAATAQNVDFNIGFAPHSMNVGRQRPGAHRLHRRAFASRFKGAVRVRIVPCVTAPNPAPFVTGHMPYSARGAYVRFDLKPVDAVMRVVQTTGAKSNASDTAADKTNSSIEME
jgi:hypothetical protein